MARYQSPSRSDEEWFQIINECRHSGLGMFEINFGCISHNCREIGCCTLPMRN